MDLNRITLIGHVVQDPKSRTITSGKPLTSFTVATNRRWTDVATKERKEVVEYHPITAWGAVGSVAGKFLKKGSKVFVEGRLAHSKFESKTGPKSIAEVVVDNLILLSPKNATSTTDSSSDE